MRTGRIKTLFFLLLAVLGLGIKSTSAQPDIISIPMDTALLRAVVVGDDDLVHFSLYGAVSQCYQCTKVHWKIIGLILI